MSTTFPPSEPGRHGLAELLTLVGAVRRLAHDRTLPPAEALGRIRDAFADYDDGPGDRQAWGPGDVNRGRAPPDMSLMPYARQRSDLRRCTTRVQW